MLRASGPAGAVRRLRYAAAVPELRLSEIRARYVERDQPLIAQEVAIVQMSVGAVPHPRSSTRLVAARGSPAAAMQRADFHFGVGPQSWTDIARALAIVPVLIRGSMLWVNWRSSKIASCNFGLHFGSPL